MGSPKVSPQSTGPEPPASGPTAASKPAVYFSTARTDVVPLLPDPLGRVLDVGCGAGSTGRLLRPRHPTRLVGIEIDPEAAGEAAAIYDEVLVGSCEELLAGLDGPFDTILCYDVLEHLVDPWAALAQCARLCVPGGRLHVSVPNARHLSLMVDVMLRGTFGYTAHGHRDDTHLRWFTPRDIETAIEGAGFAIRSRSHPAISPARRALAAMTRGRSTEFLVVQWQVLAVRLPAAPGTAQA
jgi:2-polyprenyl-3-methyl-5-hydroxy-6-metoxy-1,4-benzoquinol methylase